MSRFGYLRAPLPANASAEAQADAHGFLNEGAVAGALRPLPLERITAPTLIASVENDGYRTFAGARYTADRIPGARFIGYARGGHLLVGHDVEFLAEVVKFLDARSAGVQ